jgi:tRNA dimethylallyltransferase
MRARPTAGAVTADLPPAVFLMGPTAAGKTDLAVELVDRLPLDIISVDSAMVYRGMDVGTAKPDAALLARAPHRLIDICDPAEAYSAARFRADALQAMAEITAAGRVPLLVGGTMLYFRALTQGLAELPRADPGLRARLAQEARLFGLGHLHRRLAAVDPAAAARIHPNDPQRIQRALEVWELTGRPLSVQQAAGEARLPYRPVKLVRAPTDRHALDEPIARRFGLMLQRGLEAEVRALLARGDLAPDLPSLRSVGYRQMVLYLLGEWDHATMVERAVNATRQLAKRQYTWLRAEREAAWVVGDAAGALAQALKMLAGVANCR